MRLYKVLTSKPAELDIIEAETYIREVFLDPITAERTAKQIQLKINSLAIFPERNKLENGYYSAKVKNYRIIYKVNRKTVFVVRVLHVRQLLGKQLGDNR